jgi:hypothetical protein
MENPSAESIKKRVEDLTGIVNWVAEIWHSKNWVRRILLPDILLFTAFNPFFSAVLKLIPDSFVPSSYDRYFWAAVGLFFVVALIIGGREQFALEIRIFRILCESFSSSDFPRSMSFNTPLVALALV